MARKRSGFGFSLIPKLLLGYEIAAFGWNWYQQNTNPTGGTLLPFDGIGALIGYPGAASGTEGLLQTDL